MLKNIVDAVLYLARQEMAFRRHDESSTSLNQGNYREHLKSFGKLDSVFNLIGVCMAGFRRLKGVSLGVFLLVFHLMSRMM